MTQIYLETELDTLSEVILSLDEMITMKEWIHNLKSKEEQINNRKDIETLQYIQIKNKRLYTDLQNKMYNEKDLNNQFKQ
jgi:predicted transposase YbfD/YdcC